MSCPFPPNLPPPSPPEEVLHYVFHYYFYWNIHMESPQLCEAMAMLRQKKNNKKTIPRLSIFFLPPLPFFHQWATKKSAHTHKNTQAKRSIRSTKMAKYSSPPLSPTHLHPVLFPSRSRLPTQAIHTCLTIERKKITSINATSPPPLHCCLHQCRTLPKKKQKNKKNKPNQTKHTHPSTVLFY